MPTAAPLVRVVRSGLVESVHLGHVVVCDPEGRVLAALGDPDRLVFSRSSMKPLQAAVSLRRIAEPLPDDLVAIMCASHNGEPVHVRRRPAPAAGRRAVRTRPGVPAGPADRGRGSPGGRRTPTDHPQLLGQARRHAPRVRALGRRPRELPRTLAPPPARDPARRAFGHRRRPAGRGGRRVRRPRPRAPAARHGHPVRPAGQTRAARSPRCSRRSGGRGDALGAVPGRGARPFGHATDGGGARASSARSGRRACTARPSPTPGSGSPCGSTTGATAPPRRRW